MTTQKDWTNPECGQQWPASRLVCLTCLLVYKPLHALPYCISAGPYNQENLAKVTLCHFQDEVIKIILAFSSIVCVPTYVCVHVFLLDCLLWGKLVAMLLATLWRDHRAKN